MKNAQEFFEFMSGSASARTSKPNVSLDFLFIGELAKKLGVNPKTIRFYERVGLLKPLRHGNFRTYLKTDIERLSVVLAMRKLGVSIASIKSLSLAGDGEEGIQFIEKSLREHLNHLSEQKLILEEQLNDTCKVLERFNGNNSSMEHTADV